MIMYLWPQRIRKVKRKKQTPIKLLLPVPISQILMIMTTTSTSFTSSNVVLNTPNSSLNFFNSCGNAVSLGFHFPFLHPKLRTKLKFKSLSMSRTTHFNVSQDSLTPTEQSLSSSVEHDLLIVGPGVLGRLVAQKWRQVLSFFSFLIFIFVYCKLKFTSI